MKKILLPFIVLTFIAFCAKAQDEERSPRVTAGFSVGVATGNHTADYPVAMGLEAKLEFPVSDAPISLLVSAGFNFFVSSDGYYTGYSSYDGGYTYGSVKSFLPLQVGARVYAGKLYFEGRAGASFLLSDADGYYVNNKAALIISPTIGYGFRFDRNNKYGLDLGLGYENRFEKDHNFGQVAVRVAFSLGL